jgi:hypothetical protein
MTRIRRRRHVGLNRQNGVQCIFCDAPYLKLRQKLVPEVRRCVQANQKPIPVNYDTISDPTVICQASSLMP